MSAAAYTSQQLARFAEFVESRDACRPAECHFAEADGDRCWVTEGPPAMGGGGRCVGCHGKPTAGLARYGADR